MAMFEALIDATAQLLPELGYARLTTNAIAERAGASIGSLYEYFPGKDALIALVVERMIERVMARLSTELDAILASRREDSVDLWIERIYLVIADERALIAALLREVPYTRQLEPVRALPDRLLAFAERGRAAAGIALPQPTAALTLINNLVSTTVLQTVLDPPAGATRSELIALLTTHVKGLLESPAPRQ
jgi:AcrR family transcriptional regulator